MITHLHIGGECHRCYIFTHFACTKSLSLDMLRRLTLDLTQVRNVSHGVSWSDNGSCCSQSHKLKSSNFEVGEGARERRQAIVVYKKNTKLDSLGVQCVLLIHVARGHIGLVSNVYYLQYRDPSTVGSRSDVEHERYHPIAKGPQTKYSSCWEWWCSNRQESVVTSIVQVRHGIQSTMQVDYHKTRQ